MNIRENVTYRGFDLAITFNYWEGFSGSLEEPPELESIDIENIALRHNISRQVCLSSSQVEIDITELLGESQIQEIEEKLWEIKRDYNGD